MVLQVRLPQEHAITVLVGAAELLRVPVDLQVFGELLFVGEYLVAALEEKGGRGRGRGRGRGDNTSRVRL